MSNRRSWIPTSAFYTATDRVLTHMTMPSGQSIPYVLSSINHHGENVDERRLETIIIERQC